MEKTLSGYIRHGPGDRGRRHPAYPDIHITRTAAMYGISTSHLHRMLDGLAGTNPHGRPAGNPSLRVIETLAAIFGRSVQEIAQVYQERRKPKEKEKGKSNAKNVVRSQNQIAAR